MYFDTGMSKSIQELHSLKIVSHYHFSRVAEQPHFSVFLLLTIVTEIENAQFTWLNIFKQFGVYSSLGIFTCGDFISGNKRLSLSDPLSYRDN